MSCLCEGRVAGLLNFIKALRGSAKADCVILCSDTFEVALPLLTLFESLGEIKVFFTIFAC